MSKNYPSRQASIIGISATFVLSMLTMTSSPASAEVDDPNFRGSVRGRTVDVRGAVNGNGGGRPRVVLNENFTTIATFSNQPCRNSVGQQSVFGIVQNETTGATQRICLRRAQSGTTGQNIIGVAKKAVPVPKIDTDFKGDFLTGAEIKFSSTELRNFTVNVPNFPGAFFTITAIDCKWDFGDGTTSTDLEPTKTYESIAPNPANPDDNKVRVSVTANWQAVLNDNGTVTDIGVVSGTGTIDRSIVQVWSKQTELNT